MRKTLHERIRKWRHYYWTAKSRLYYCTQFHSFGRNSVLYRPLYIQFPELIDIGDNVFIRDGVRLEMVLDLYGRTPRLSIGSGTNIEQDVHIICHNRISIGQNVSVTGRCAIVDVTHPFHDLASHQKIGARIKDEDSFVEIGDGAFLGYGAVILPNVRIGRSAVIGANSVVTKDVPDFGVAAGNPAIIREVYDFSIQEWRRYTGSERLNQ